MPNSRRSDSVPPASPSLSPELVALLRRITDAGGQPMLVGGWVRDRLLGIHSKDKDIEVFHLPFSDLKNLCRRHGRVFTVGAAFAVLKVTLRDGETVDISIPRREYHIGEGHRGFDVHADPAMSIAAAAERRDLTVNAISMDPFTFEPIDPTGGMVDLAERRLRHVGPRFREDPLRVLRVYQFQARLAFTIAPETRALCREISAAGMLLTLPRERIEEELKKFFLRGQPDWIDVALRHARQDGVIAAVLPELATLGSVPQDPRYHAEGDVLEHTIRAVAEAAASARRAGLDDLNRWILCLAALTHDLGKAVVTRSTPGGIVSYGHDKAGEEPARALLERITGQVKVIDHVLALVRTHMRPLMLAQAKTVSDTAIRRLATAVQPSSIDMLCYLTEADTAASVRGDGTEPVNAHVFLRERAEAV
ncbi:HD domain-containing protein, partial [bacterium]|nr:HD domain-containing protein [candidate division CSSED10-310 bacterium]